jgi:hypothetical protein
VPYFFYGCVILPLETLLPRRSEWGSSLPPDCFVSRGSICTWVILNIRFLRRGVVSTSPNPKAGGPPLVGCPRLLIQFIHSYPRYRRPFLHPQPEDAPCRGDRDPHSWVRDFYRGINDVKKGYQPRTRIVFGMGFLISISSFYQFEAFYFGQVPELNSFVHNTNFRYSVR